jgi:hypothetical protein
MRRSFELMSLKFYVCFNSLAGTWANTILLNFHNDQLRQSIEILFIESVREIETMTVIEQKPLSNQTQLLFVSEKQLFLLWPD